MFLFSKLWHWLLFSQIPDPQAMSGTFTRLYAVTLLNAVAEVRCAGGRVRRIVPILMVDRR